MSALSTGMTMGGSLRLLVVFTACLQRYWTAGKINDRLLVVFTVCL